MSVFLERNHLFARKPSDAGDPAAMKAAGFGAVFCNIGDYPPEEWQALRERAAAAGMVCGPWLRTADASHQWDPDRLELLIDTADAWGWTPLIVNSESELKGSGDELTTYIAEQLGERDAAVSMEPRPFANVHWYPLAAYPILPQKFPAEQSTQDTDAQIRANWWAYGIRCVVITYGSYGGMQAVDFERLSPYGVYTSDDCGNNFMPWASLGEVDPCSSPPPEPPNGGGEEVEEIGNQHGITAMANIFREQWPDKTGKPDPDDHTTWKAIDKWERAQLILAEDHDQQAKGASDA
jgi:hypothetical protein